MCKRNHNNEYTTSCETTGENEPVDSEIKPNESSSGPFLFTLSPDYSKDTGFIEADTDSVYKTYESYLNAALSKKDVLNIAVTGDFGIGKSSFLNWYAKGKEYLFVSLCDYSNGEKDLFSLGCDIYRQLMIKSGRAKERRKRRNGLVLFGISLFITAIVCFYLLYYDAFGSLARFAEIVLSPGESRSDLFKSIINARKIVDCITGSAVLIGIPFLVRWAFSKIASAKLSVKANNVEAEMQLEHKEKSFPFDLNKVNIVEELRSSAKEFGNTIIFEDFDRTSNVNCIALFTELRELNRLINGSLGIDEKQVRFVYVLKDGLFCSQFEDKQSGADDQMEKCDRNISLKFFDVIIPFVPGIYGHAASANIRDVLDKVHVNKECIDEYIRIVGEFLYDYRTIRNIANEFSVIRSVYYSRKDATDDLNDKYILALATYKTIVPEEYTRIRSGCSQPFDNLASHKNPCIQALADKGWLCDHCLIYIGLNPTEIKKYILQLDEDAEDTGKTIRDFINSCYSMMREAMLLDEKFMSLVLKYCAYNVLIKEMSQPATTELLNKALNTFTGETNEDWTVVNGNGYVFDQLEQNKDRYILGIKYLLKVGCKDWSLWKFDADSFVKLTNDLNDEEIESFIKGAEDIIKGFIETLCNNDREGFRKLLHSLTRPTLIQLITLDFSQSVKQALSSLIKNSSIE